MKYLANVVSLELMAEKCTGCGRCVEVCPHGVFVLEDRRAAITDRDRCMECGACALNCAFGALQVNAGVGCAQAIIHSMIYGGEPTCDCSGPAQGPRSCC
ncbi:MAG: 4Fe-4S binding protein [Nitrospiraceae bacterium]|nr:4Fe-4S binding protein [Nitrospiraceae bacterium]